MKHADCCTHYEREIFTQSCTLEHLHECFLYWWDIQIHAWSLAANVDRDYMHMLHVACNCKHCATSQCFDKRLAYRYRDSSECTVTYNLHVCLQEQMLVVKLSSIQRLPHARAQSKLPYPQGLLDSLYLILVLKPATKSHSHHSYSYFFPFTGTASTIHHSCTWINAGFIRSASRMYRRPSSSWR